MEDDSRWERYFEPGEILLWEGGPVSDRRVTPAQIGFAVFGLPFLSFGLAFLFQEILVPLGGGTRPDGTGVSVVSFFFALPFIAIGAALVFGPHLGARLAPRYVRYALSNRRAYIARRWWRRPTLTVYPILRDAALEITEGPTDSVRFYLRETHDQEGETSRMTGAFENIADGKAVYDLLRRVQRGEA